jgi:hypothetical protein
MLFISIIDMAALWIITFYITWQFFQGAVYCTQPYTNYCLGTIVMSMAMIVFFLNCMSIFALNFELCNAIYMLR